MENPILNMCYESRGGHYVHALEVEDVADIDNCISEIISAHYDCGIEAIKEFFNTMSIYYIGEDSNMESQVYDYDFDKNIDYLYA